MSLIKDVFSNTRKPTDTKAGWKMLEGMNRGHRAGNNWSLDQLPARKFQSILDVGCGGGQIFANLHYRYPSAQLAGVDYSPTSVAASIALNHELVDDGVLMVEEADVAALPFPDSTFDLVTACETIYFWPDLVNNMREVRRTLKRNGVFMVSCELDTKWMAFPWTKIIDMRVYYRDEIAHAMEAAGFTKVRVLRRPGLKGWICVIGTNPRR